MNAAFYRNFDTAAKPHWGEILRCLSLHAPMAVKSLSKKLGMSYMGVKQHCQEMHSQGLLAVREEKGGVGRPRHLYFMTPDAWTLFPESLDSMLITQIRDAEGESTAHRFLLNWFQAKASNWVARLPPSGMERLKEARLLLLDEGCVAEWVKHPKSRQPALLVSHRPWAAATEAIPQLIRTETQFLSTICGLAFERESQPRDPMPPTTIFYQP